MFFTNKVSQISHTVSGLGLEWKVECSLRALLGLLKDKTPVQWLYSDDVNADVIVYNPDSPLAQALLRRESQASQRRVLIPCGLSEAGTSGLSLPLGATRLLHCLEIAAVQLGTQGNTGHADEKNLCLKLYEALNGKDTSAVAIESGKQRGLLVPRLRAVYWSKPMDGDAVAQMLLEPVSVQPIKSDDAQIQRHIEHHASNAHGWDAPLWAIGVGTSGGHLLPQIKPDRAYQISRWPDFGLIGRRSSDIKCSALLSHKPYTPQGLAEVSGIPASTVHNFLNACGLCGVLELVPVGPPLAAVMPAPCGSPAKGFLSRIRDVFTLNH